MERTHSERKMAVEGEAFEWILEDKNTVWLRRVAPKSRRSAPKKSIPPL